jgi:hypothetical protein
MDEPPRLTEHARLIFELAIVTVGLIIIALIFMNLPWQTT